MLIYSTKKLEFDSVKETLAGYCDTDYGKLEAGYIRFYREKIIIERELDRVDEALNVMLQTDIRFGEWYPVWEEIKSAKLKNKVLLGIDLYKIAKTLIAASQIKEFFVSRNTPAIHEICSQIHNFEDITRDILSSIGKEGNVFDKASKELAAIRDNIRRLKSEIESRLEAILRRRENEHAIQENIITQRENRYVIPIKKDHKGKFRGIVLDTSNTGETLFIEPEQIVDKNNALIEAIHEEQQEEVKIRRRLSSYITKRWSAIKESLKAFGKTDLVLAKARYADKLSCARPLINENGYWHLRKARHPALGQKAVPVDMSLGKDFLQLIITGPNTGGKTVCLKTLGILTLMASAGLFIPALEQSEISVVDSIYIDIGDEQSINQNLSTFSGHINRIKKILKNATLNSLVLIDELGAGTDPADGAALGVAVLEKLLEKQCRVVVTTHFEQIKNFAFFSTGVETASVEFDLETLTPKYRLLMGVAGKSDALLIAKQLGIDENIVKRAQELQNRGKYSQDELVAELNKEKTRYLSLMAEAEQMNFEAKKRKKELEQKDKELKNLETEIKQGEIYKTIESVKQTREELARIRAKLKKHSLSEEEIKEEVSLVEKLGRDLHEETVKEQKNETGRIEIHRLSVGIKVFLSNLQKEGIVSEIDKSKNEVTVSIGSIKIKTPISDIEKIIEENSTRQIQQDFSMRFRHNIPKPEYECHIRGMRADDAVKKAQDYIESVIIHETEKGRIVHGKGEGILRQIIHDMLKEHPHIAKYQLAHPNEGGWGVTEFWIKN